MANPNNCEACDHKQRPDGGFCYMFADAPEEVCMIHTARTNEELQFKASLLTLTNMFDRGLLKATSKALGRGIHNES